MEKRCHGGSVLLYHPTHAPCEIFVNLHTDIRFVALQCDIVPFQIVENRLFRWPQLRTKLMENDHYYLCGMCFRTARVKSNDSEKSNGFKRIQTAYLLRSGTRWFSNWASRVRLPMQSSNNPFFRPPRTATNFPDASESVIVNSLIVWPLAMAWRCDSRQRMTLKMWKRDLC